MFVQAGTTDLDLPLPPLFEVSLLSPKDRLCVGTPKRRALSATPINAP
jgi:hypothetical protein